MVPELLLRASVGIPIALIASYVLYTFIFTKSDFDHLPWIGADKNQWFWKLRAKIAVTRDYQTAIKDAYENYSKKGLTCILPGLTGNLVLLPVSQTNWIINTPDELLNTKEVHREGLQTEYTFLDANLVKHPYHEDVVKHELTRKLGGLTTEIMEELAAGFDEFWGFDTENWKEICVFENMMKIVARTSNRIFVGLPLCRNEDYLQNAAKFAQDIPISAQLCRMLPRSLAPIFAPIITLPNRYHKSRLRPHFLPIIKERQNALDRKESDPEYKYEEPNDFMQWFITYARESLPEYESKSDTIVGRMLTLNFAAIHTSTFTITNAVFDLVSAPPSAGYLDGIRDEAACVLAEDGGVWTKAGLSRMVRVDSALRESLRLKGFLARGLVRKVMPKEGVTTQDGLHLRKGTDVGVAVYGVHVDEQVYNKPLEYDAFRFSRVREEFEAGDKSGHQDHNSEVLRHKNLSMVTTSEQFQPFGHGRHACPGRFFAANELKLLLAYIALNYEVEPLPERPAGMWIGETVLPPMKATIRVRRRKTPFTG